ncbi:MAG TPA: hypothetical protein VMV26_15830 [Alphaproteobacteria bacterium]|jgi:hypothetical protein|nr:hypothetical protein [Alphaproteobacteria bacterium]
MIRTIALVALLLFVAALAPAVHAQDVPAGVRIQGGYVSGNEYLDMSVQQREAYVAGLLLGMRLAPSFGAPLDRLDWLNGCTTVLDRAALAQRIYDALFADAKLWDNRNPAKMYRAVVAGCRAAAKGARTAAATPFTVNDYVAMGGLEKKEFVSGLIEGMLLAPAFGGQESRMDWFLSCTAAHDRLQMRAKLNAFVMAHNELWPETSPAPYFRAVADACAEWANQRPQNSGR